MVTKGGYLKGSRLYKTSKTIGQGVAKSRSQLNTYIKSEHGNVIYLKH